MSDWVIDDATNSGTGNKQTLNSSEWELAPEETQAPDQKESLGYSVLAAGPRMAVDALKGGYNFFNKIPQYYESAKTQIPNAASAWMNHPLHALGQGIAGLAEQGQNVFNAPHDLANYATNRLNLIPQDVNQKIQMARMPDSSQQINQTFGQPKYPGEELIRGGMRNSESILGGAGIAKLLNPMNLTAGGIARNVVKERANQIAKHEDMYNNLWDKAKDAGINKVNYDPNVIQPVANILDKFYPEKSGVGLKKFIQDPNLTTAQKAQSELGNLKTSLEEKAKLGPLLESERGMHQLLANGEKHIENNMFKDANGKINKNLFKQYNKITKSYAQNVVPYRYNPAIQAYRSKDITAGELVDSLKKGNFAANKGWKHPAIKIRGAVMPTASGIGLLGGGAYLYNQMFGGKPPPINTSGQ